MSPNTDVEGRPPWLERLREEWSAELIETHISWLLLTDDTVYKFKRPLRLPFLDYSTLALRQHWCEEEVRLGCRYTDIYLGVTHAGVNGEPAVVMRRFDERLRLDHLCAAGALHDDQVRGLVDQMIEIHRASPSADPAGPLGSPELIARQIGDTLAQLRVQPDVDLAEVSRVAQWLHDETGRLATVLRNRQVGGFIREGHGDLHLANLILRHGHAVAFDGIEFSDELRWLDLSSELAFTYADLLRHDQPALAAAVPEQWLTRTGDAEGLALMRMHACHKALVRAMVAGMMADHATRARYLATAATLIGGEHPPRLLVTYGYSGSGKSTFAAHHTRTDPRAATLWLRADVERKRLHGVDPQGAQRAAVETGIYTPEATRRTYDHLARMSGPLLASGWSVVVDATFGDRARRDQFRRVAADHGATFGIVECLAPEAELRSRIASRRNDVSDADDNVLDHQLRTVDALSAAERSDVWRTIGQQ